MSTGKEIAARLLADRKSAAVRPGAEAPTLPKGMKCPQCEVALAEMVKANNAADAAEAEVSRLTAERDAAESVIRNAAHLCSTRMEGKTISESYVAAYRLLFAYLYPDGDAALGSGSPTGETR